MDWRILNTLDISGVPEATAALEAVGRLDNLPPERGEVLRLLPEYDAYMASASVQIDDEFLARAMRLKVIGSPSTGNDHMDLAAIRAAGIELFDIAKEYELINSFSATSELAFGLALSVIRHIPTAVASAHQGNWARERYSGFQLLGKTLGIIGLGRLGKISARIGNGFAMRVLATDIVETSAPNVEMVELDTLLRQSDLVLLHVPLNDTTRGMIGAEQLALMKNTAILVNTTRGKVVHEPALLEALEGGGIAGAGLDVIDGEWLTAEELCRHPLIAHAGRYENLVITPHIGGSTTESIYGARVYMANKLADYLRGQSAVQLEASKGRST